MNLFRLYRAIGGMPQAVQEYVETQDFLKVETVKHLILTLYRNDIRKYADWDELKVTAICYPMVLSIFHCIWCLCYKDTFYVTA